jgi:N-acetylmuramoyl-L-alanine amidase
MRAVRVRLPIHLPKPLVWLACGLLALSLGAPLAAQDPFSGLARLDVAQSQVRDQGNGLNVTLYLSQPVPFRVFTLDAPRRLVLDFREVDWRGATRAGLLNANLASDLRFGALRPGWSRLVIDLVSPLIIETAGMVVDDTDGTAEVSVNLQPGTAADFAAQSGAPPDPDWAVPAAPPLVAALPTDDGLLTVVIDPGHGGIDPGADRAGMVEKDVMLQLALELAEAVNRTDGLQAVLTRSTDMFVPLADRMSIARAAGADLFISLHADALDEDATSGASVYTLTDAAVDQASERMAERHDRGDLLAGLDLSGADDTVATVLMDLARLETAPQASRFADALVLGLEDAGAGVNRHPRREAPLAVLNAADFPSVLAEVGFLSSERDRTALSTTAGRAPIVTGIVTAIGRWAVDEAARAPLIRQ